MNAAEPVSPTGQLRQATWPLHHRLDHHPTLAPLLAPGLDASVYGNLLACLHPPQMALESALTRSWHLLPATYDLAPRLADLETDLEALDIRPGPVSLQLDPADALPGLIGQLYVYEGARLGAAHIARALAERAPMLPSAYFSNARGPARWPRFQVLAQSLRSEANIKQACLEARRVFQSFLDSMDQGAKDSGHHP
ncbi:MAG: biliverdin-producing heme oxygenase [Pseudomonadota bacterium]